MKFSVQWSHRNLQPNIRIAYPLWKALACRRTYCWASRRDTTAYDGMLLASMQLYMRLASTRSSYGIQELFAKCPKLKYSPRHLNWDNVIFKYFFRIKNAYQFSLLMKCQVTFFKIFTHWFSNSLTPDIIKTHDKLSRLQITPFEKAIK